MTTIRLRALDLETSAMDDGEVVEIGWTDVWATFTEVVTDGEAKMMKEFVIEPPRSILFRPERGMTPGAQGTHHISMARVRDLPVCTEDDLRIAARLGAPDFLVAHNNDYEKKFFTDDIIAEHQRWICTFKGARRAWEEAPEHNLQALKYWRGLELDDAFAMPPHRAGPDSYVGACILVQLLQTESLRDLVQWTRQHLHHPLCPLRPHRGKPWGVVPHDFLTWMVRKSGDMDADIINAARLELERRKGISDAPG